MLYIFFGYIRVYGVYEYIDNIKYITIYYIYSYCYPNVINQSLSTL